MSDLKEKRATLPIGKSKTNQGMVKSLAKVDAKFLIADIDEENR